ncbi:hypothetical protein GGX14DRAFT_574807 [Mycena pura]|uniref:Uncharacterized protein n=1 Tax=Mycena pura TaxID=153505 RepID=A0AAD6Y2U2_9AGAR|nr:hypothetical protein GGX14DRAFT_574807 [Mycena pura]
MTPPTRLAALPNPSLEPLITAGQLLKPLDFTSTQTIFLFPPMSSKMKGSPSRAPDPIDDAFYVTPTPSQFWAAFNHSGSRPFIPATVATNAMNIGIRATRYLFAQLHNNNDPPEDILALVGLVYQLSGLVPAPLAEYSQIPTLSTPEHLLPENFQVPFWTAPTELELANAPVFPQSFPKTPARLSSIARQPDEDVEEEQDGDDGDGAVEMERPGRSPTPPPSPSKGKRSRPTTRSERKSAEYVEDSDNESVPASKVAKSSRSGNAASQSRQPRSAMNRDVAVVLKKPKLLDKDEGIIRNTTLTDIKDRLGQAVVSILQTKETFHKRVNIDLPDDAAATITVAVARKGPGVKPPCRSALGSATHSRARETDDFESEFAPLELIPLTQGLRVVPPTYLNVLDTPAPANQTAPAPGWRDPVTCAIKAPPRVGPGLPLRCPVPPTLNALDAPAPADQTAPAPGWRDLVTCASAAGRAPGYRRAGCRCAARAARTAYLLGNGGGRAGVHTLSAAWAPCPPHAWVPVSRAGGHGPCCPPRARYLRHARACIDRPPRGPFHRTHALSAARCGRALSIRCALANAFSQAQASTPSSLYRARGHGAVRCAHAVSAMCARALSVRRVGALSTPARCPPRDASLTAGVHALSAVRGRALVPAPASVHGDMYIGAAAGQRVDSGRRAPADGCDACGSRHSSHSPTARTSAGLSGAGDGSGARRRVHAGAGVQPCRYTLGARRRCVHAGANAPAPVHCVDANAPAPVHCVHAGAALGKRPVRTQSLPAPAVHASKLDRALVPLRSYTPAPSRPRPPGRHKRPRPPPGRHKRPRPPPVHRACCMLSLPAPL